MMTECYRSELVRLVEDGTIPEALIDESVLRILTLKNKLGLFEDPYKGMGAEKEAQMQLTEAHRALARKAAAQTFVLLKTKVDCFRCRRKRRLPLSVLIQTASV